MLFQATGVLDELNYQRNLSVDTHCVAYLIWSGFLSWMRDMFATIEWRRCVTSTFFEASVLAARWTVILVVRLPTGWAFNGILLSSKHQLCAVCQARPLCCDVRGVVTNITAGRILRKNSWQGSRCRVWVWCLRTSRADMHRCCFFKLSSQTACKRAGVFCVDVVCVGAIVARLANIQIHRLRLVLTDWWRSARSFSYC